MSKTKIIILILTFICFAIWIISDLIHTKASVPVTEQLQTALSPVDPNLDQETLKKVSDLNDNIGPVATSVPKSSAIIPVATGSAQVSPTPVASALPTATPSSVPNIP